MNATIDDERCKGCGQCADLCPAVFALNGHTARVRVTWIPVESEAACHLAMQRCPPRAISAGEAQALMLADASGSSSRWLAL